MEDTLKFIDDVIAEYNERMKSQPYQINLLEEVHMHDDGQRKDLSGAKKKICENAHTRILERILRFQNQEGYIFLKSLIDYIQEKSRSESWSNIHVDAPMYKSEFNCDKISGRIDLLIWEEGKYALIFENKINEAGDQSNQIARYISHLCQSGFSEEQVFVLYLSAEGIEKEFRQTWQLDGADYKESFVPRFFDLSYRYEILPWLTDKATSIVNHMYRQIPLKSAIDQYIDYLNGKFSLRKAEKSLMIQLLNHKLDIETTVNQRLWKVDSLITKARSISSNLNAELNKDHIRVLNHIIESCEEIKSETIKQRLLPTINYNEFLRRHFRRRDVYLGYQIPLNDRTYLLYIGKSPSNYLACSAISLPNEEAMDEVSASIFQRFLTKGKNGYRYIQCKTNDGKWDYEYAITVYNSILSLLNNDYK